MSKYSFERCLQNSYRINWTIEGVLEDHRFDPDRRWLPLSLSGASRVQGLSETERRKLTQIEMASYAHLFGYVEEFIAPKVSELAMDVAGEDRTAFHALTNFAAEEVKHMMLFFRVRQRVDQALGFDTELVGGAGETADYILSKNNGAVLLFTACLEWYTQLHYVDAFKEDDDLDELTKRVFKAHWLEESQHAQMDHLETLRAFADMDEAERETAIDDMIELFGSVDELLQAQVELDMRNFERHLDRPLQEPERIELHAAVLAAKRYTFLECGMLHPRFLELYEDVTTPGQRERVSAAMQQILAPATSAA